jgi:hypothetical protein
MKKFAVAAICTLVVVGYVVADDYTLFITKIEDGKVTGKKFGKKGGKAEEVTVILDKDAKVFKGKFDPEAKGLAKDGDAIKMDDMKSALKDAQKDNEKGGLIARVTTEGEGDKEKITTVIFTTFGKKKDKN